MPEYNIYQVDAFTDEVFRGNPAGVVLNADSLSDQQMQSIAGELNNSETAFLFSPDDTDYDLNVRFFTPITEVPSCGHATIAASYVWAHINDLDETVIRIKIKIGILDVEVRNTDSHTRYRIYMNQGKPVFLNKLEGQDRTKLLRGLGLNEEDLISDLPIQIVSTGHSKLMVPIKHRAKLHSLKPDMKSLKKLNSVIGCNGYFIFTLDSDEPGILTHARMFAPAIGIPEDPVTGNGNGPLGAYLVKYNLTKHNGRSLEFISRQGEAMNRAGLAHVEVQIDSGDPVIVKVGGDAIIVFQTKMVIES